MKVLFVLRLIGDVLGTLCCWFCDKCVAGDRSVSLPRSVRTFELAGSKASRVGSLLSFRERAAIAAAVTRNRFYVRCMGGGTCPYGNLYITGLAETAGGFNFAARGHDLHRLAPVSPDHHRSSLQDSVEDPIVVQSLFLSGSAQGTP